MMIELLPLKDQIDAAEWTNTLMKKVQPLRPQLQATSLTLNETCNKIEVILEHAKHLLETGNINPAVKHLLEIENRLLEPVEKVVECMYAVLVERMKEKNTPVLSVLDCMATEVFSKVFEEQRVSQEVKPMPPVFYAQPELLPEQVWQHAQEALFQQGLGAPICLATLVPNIADQPHNVIRGLLAIGRKVYDETLINQEILAYCGSVCSPGVLDTSGNFSWLG